MENVLKFVILKGGRFKMKIYKAKVSATVELMVKVKEYDNG